MPSRIIREGILTSEEVNKLSERAELFYRRLMSVADDYGRFYAHPSILRASCYPLRLDSVSEASVKQMLNECLKSLIVVYGDGKYLQMLKFRQQTRAKSKFPEPTENELLIKCDSGEKRLTTSPAGTRLRNTTTTTNPNSFQKPNIEEVIQYCVKVGLPQSDGEWFFHKCEGNGWTNNGKPIKKWEGVVSSWKTAGYMLSQKQSQVQQRPVGGNL